MIPQYNANHTQEALDRLISQFQGKYNIAQLIKSIMVGVQELEDEIFVFLGSFLIDTAVGDQLDILGSIVGQERGQFSDEIYRLLIKGRVAANISAAGNRDILNLLSIIDPDSNYYDTVATINIESALDFDGYSDWELGAAYLELLTSAKGIGVSYKVHDSSMLELGEQGFRFSGVEGQSFGHGGFSDIDDITGIPEENGVYIDGILTNLITP